MKDIWEFDRYCSCTWCKGGKNKHAWSFYYFCKRKGDNVEANVSETKITMRIKDRADG